MSNEISHVISTTVPNINEIASYLMSLDPKQVTVVPNQGQTTLARIVDIHDGDTIKVLLMLGSSPIKLSIRVMGIDSPEITKRGGTTQQEVDAAKKIRDYVVRLFSGSPLCYVVLEKEDKYCGRFMGDLYLQSGEKLSQHLLQLGCVKPYSGDKKDVWTPEQLAHIDTIMCRALGY